MSTTWGPAFTTQIITKTLTFTGSGATVVTPIFGLTGSVKVKRLFGIVTSTIGASHTAALFRLFDQTIAQSITANGAILSNSPIGTYLSKNALSATTATVKSAAGGGVAEPGLVGAMVQSEFDIIKKNGAVTTIDYSYATVDLPTTGAMQFFAYFEPLSAGSTLVAL